MNKTKFLTRAQWILNKTLKNLNTLKPLSIQGFDPKHTLLIIVDMVNGFAQEGALYSPRVRNLIPEIQRVSALCTQNGIPILAFADSHSLESPEFKHYPAHCLRGDKESALIDELRGQCFIINKNSTNGFLEDSFQSYLRSHPEINTFLLVGNCIDICVSQLALSLRADFDRRNNESQVIVLTNCVATFDIPNIHDGDFYHLLGLITLSSNGIQLAKTLIEGEGL